MFQFFSNLTITSLGFFVFVIIILAVYYIIPKKYQNLILLLGSYLFCFTWSINFVIPIFIYSTINYFLALKISRSESNKKYFLWVAIGLNLLGLIGYKYFDTFQYITSTALPRIGIPYEYNLLNVLQPIGISFYVLQAISYLIDVYRGQISANKNFIETSLYLAYFPKLIVGPIEQAGKFFKQLTSDREINNQQIIDGFTKIVVGLTRKIIIAETILESIPSELFIKPNNFSPPDLIFWWLCFAFVIYNDFAGYTSIALGISSLFGINLSQNFQQPFFSTSFIDFWNRWHISLSNWLRDYIYLPLSRWMLHRNPSGKYLPNLIIPPLLTMVISGLWHGAAFHFILWGALNGLLQGVERIQKSRKKITKDKPNKIIQVINIFGTFLILFLISIPFKFDVAQSFEIWSRLFLWNKAEFIFSISFGLAFKPVMALGLSFLIDYLQLPNNTEERIANMPKKIKVFVTAAFIFVLFLATRQQALTPFIYQEF